MKIKIPCTLCTQPVVTKGFTLNTTEGKATFCCEGCLSIYSLFNENKLLTSEKREKNESL
jgi:hypothetical protein